MFVKIISRGPDQSVVGYECVKYRYVPNHDGETVTLTLNDRDDRERVIVVSDQVDVWFENNEGRTVDRINIEPKDPSVYVPGAPPQVEATA